MAEKEYIERDSVLRSLAVLLQMPFTGLDDAWEVVQKTPAADVVEVRHGEWKQNPYHKSIYYCSECGELVEDGSCNPYKHFPYCHCGAKMDGYGERKTEGG